MPNVLSAEKRSQDHEALRVLFLCSISALGVLFLCSISALGVLFLCSISGRSEKIDSVTDYLSAGV
jgi:hypothetical protein